MSVKQSQEKLKNSAFWEYFLECRAYIVRNKRLLYLTFVVILCGTISLTALLLPYVAKQQASYSDTANNPSTTQSILVPAELCVHVTGAVQRPGVYTLYTGDHVIDAIQAAGGFTEDALQDGINQAGALSDGQMLVIPSRESTATAQMVREPNAAISVVNLNTATAEQLLTLPGIGKKKAENIIKYRELAGSFQKIEDLMNVEGIGPHVFQQLQCYITI